MILVPQPGIDPSTPRVEVQCLNPWSPKIVTYILSFYNLYKERKAYIQNRYNNIKEVTL